MSISKLKLHDIQEFGIAPAKAGDIRVDRLEQRLKPRVPFPHKHNFFHFLCLRKARGSHEIDFQRFSAASNQVFFVKPGEVHAWDFSPSTRGFVIEFSRESLRGDFWTKQGGLSQLDSLPSVFSFTQEEGFLALCELMLVEVETQGAGGALCLENLVSVFLLKAMRQTKTESPKSKGARNDLVARFSALVEEEFYREHSPEFYADCLGVTAKALTMRCRRVLGKPAGIVIRDRILLEAKRLLSYGDSAIAEIGYKLGFEDPNYFARFFRTQSGISPGRFRNLAKRTLI